MYNMKHFLLIFSSSIVLLLSLFFDSIRAYDCALNNLDKYKVAYTIRVDRRGLGYGNFTTIQDAINSVPDGNNRWIHIQILPGKYVEKVKIPYTKPCIYLHGHSSHLVTLEWGDHGKIINNDATFSSEAKNTVVKGITFKNTFNIPRNGIYNDPIIQQAVAVVVREDKTAFYNCAFYGIQDTLWDNSGRHYFRECYIQGSSDFIFGNGQSIYEQCEIVSTAGAYGSEIKYGYITAQRRDTPSDPGGFVFKYCTFDGTLKTYLGRPWGHITPYSRVLVFKSNLSNIIFPQGWSIGNFGGKERYTSFSEYACTGPGANTQGRVPWMKKLSRYQAGQLAHMSFIDSDSWLKYLPNIELM